MATILFRYADYKKYNVESDVDLKQFADGEMVSPWAEKAMSWAVGNGLFQGDDFDCLNAQNDAKRSDVAAVFMRFQEMEK